MKTVDISKAQGHWVLAKMGKRVLRPGGKELTRKLVEALSVNEEDDIVEFAPGLGYTASLTLSSNPKSYTGIDANEDAVRLLRKKFRGKDCSIINRNAAHTKLEDQSKTKVYGEAMLTMHADHRKAEIIAEANRILRQDGLYGIHELGLKDGIDEQLKAKIQRDLAMTIRVNARPLTGKEWTRLFENGGFRVKTVATNPMHLLETKRIIDDEGLFGFLKIGFNVCRNGPARRRVLDMHRVFRKYSSYMNAIVIVGEKK